MKARRRRKIDPEPGLDTFRGGYRPRLLAGSPRSWCKFIGAAGVNGWPSRSMVEVEFGDFNPEPDGDPDDQIQHGPC